MFEQEKGWRDAHCDVHPLSLRFPFPVLNKLVYLIHLAGELQAIIREMWLINASRLSSLHVNYHTPIGLVHRFYPLPGEVRSKSKYFSDTSQMASHIRL